MGKVSNPTLDGHIGIIIRDKRDERSISVSIPQKAWDDVHRMEAYDNTVAEHGDCDPNIVAIEMIMATNMNPMMAMSAIVLGKGGMLEVKPETLEKIGKFFNEQHDKHDKPDTVILNQMPNYDTVIV